MAFIKYQVSGQGFKQDPIFFSFSSCEQTGGLSCTILDSSLLKYLFLGFFFFYSCTSRIIISLCYGLKGKGKKQHGLFSFGEAVKLRFAFLVLSAYNNKVIYCAEAEQPQT